MRIRLIPAVVLPLFVSTFVHATDATVAPLIVTATRTAQTADETLASVTVITRKDIEQRQARSVEDVLRGVPGLSLANSGGPGKATSVFLRGGNSDHVLVLIDGVKVGSTTLGTTAFENIPVDQIERIEIVRGPRSSLYGSEAMGGVIQIFTRKGGGATTPFFSVGVGSYRTNNTAAGVSGGGTRGWYNLSASDFNTAGFNACNGSYSVGCYTIEPDKDGHHNVSGNLRAGYRFASGAEVDFHALRAQGNTQSDGGYINETEFAQQVLGGTLRYAPIEPWQVTFGAGRSNDNADNFENGAFMGQLNTERDTVSWQNDVSFGTNHLLSLGLDYQNDHVDSDTAYAITSRDNKGLFAQYQGAYGTEDVQIALRGDDNEQFGTHTTGSLAWGHAFAQGMRLTASYGSAFKAPSLNALYWPHDSYTDTDSGITYISGGNPNLAPESSRSAELALRHIMIGAGVLGVSVYETQARDIIDWATNQTAVNELTTLPSNVNRARIRGLEAVFGATLYEWQINSTLTLQNPENRSTGSSSGNVLPRRAQHMAHLDLDRQLGRYRFGASLFAEGRRFDELTNATRLGGYATLDLRAEYAIDRGWSLAARIANVLDKSYETAAYFNQPERNYFLTLRYQPAKR